MIFVLGPTSIGKSDFANLISKITGYKDQINIDSIQIYKELNSLTNKQNFQNFNINEKGLKFYIYQTDYLDEKEIFSKVSDIADIQFFRYKDGHQNYKCKINELSKIDDLYHLSDSRDKMTKTHNYLFNLKTIYSNETFNIREYVKLFQEVHYGLEDKNHIIVGGTIYYAFHIIKGTNFLADVEIYKKPSSRLKSFDLFLLTPKSLNRYREILNKKILGRINISSYKEIINITNSFKDKDIITKIGKLSYQYKWAIKIFQKLMNDYVDEDKIQDAIDNIIILNNYDKEIRNYIESLYIAEKNYAKRQMTFIRKLVREIL